MLCYHRTTHAEAIQQGGFRELDMHGAHGVWLTLGWAYRPANEDSAALFAVELSDEVIATAGVVKVSGPIAVIPASVVVAHKPRLLSSEEQLAVESDSATVADDVRQMAEFLNNGMEREWAIRDFGGKFPHGLNLSMIDRHEVESAVKAFECGDGEGFADCGYSKHVGLDLVLDNMKALLSRDIYEPALVQAFIGYKGNNKRFSVDLLDTMFRCGNREKLRSAGAPAPGAGPFKVYRGVAGRARARRVRGASWTLSFDVACWFASRLAHLGDPAVFEIMLQLDDVYFFYFERDEQEVVAIPTKPPKRLYRAPDEIKRAAERFMEWKKAINSKGSKANG